MLLTPHLISLFSIEYLYYSHNLPTCLCFGNASPMSMTSQAVQNTIKGGAHDVTLREPLVTSNSKCAKTCDTCSCKTLQFAASYTRKCSLTIPKSVLWVSIQDYIIFIFNLE